MGAYVNPSNMSKEDWLKRYGKLVGAVSSLPLDGLCVPTYESYPVNELPVILVDNGPFTAAAIAYSKEEYLEFVDPMDGRNRGVFSVPKDLLYEVSNLENYLPKVKGGTKA